MSEDIKNLIIAVVLTMLVLFTWQYFYELPRLREETKASSKPIATHTQPKVVEKEYTRQEVVLQSNGGRVQISTDKLSGSIALTGARIDDLILNQYKGDLNSNSPIVLLAPSKVKTAYFAEFGWLLSEGAMELPDAHTVWSANKPKLGVGDTVQLSWRNSEDMLFRIDISLDENYMFTVTQKFTNSTKAPIAIREYGLISRTLAEKQSSMAISHEGPVGSFNKVLKEMSYEKLDSDKEKSFSNNASGSWLGISDKYWLTALIPDQHINFDAKFKHIATSGKQKYQVDYVSDVQHMNPGQTNTTTAHFFAGAKVVSLLDAYAKNLNLDLFDRAVDFGWFYFLTKPLFKILNYLDGIFGNFGLAILGVTVIVKLALLPLAQKSYTSMNRMKELQPEIVRIKELYADDKVKQNQAIMELYKKQKVNPLAGCLPLLIQIPIFFSLYKVLFISLEMRHAPFYLWIKDLSAPDPTTIFNLFGLVPWAPPHFLMIGIWPIIMAFTMYLQQKMSPEPSDPMQAKLMKFLPLIFVFMFSSFPAGLIIYWAWSNVLSIAQQYFIKVQHERTQTKKAHAK